MTLTSRFIEDAVNWAWEDELTLPVHQEIRIW